ARTPARRGRGAHLRRPRGGRTGAGEHRPERLMSAPTRVVIVGANVGGARAADTLRKYGFDGHITLVGAEPDLPYERPPLSKELLWGTLPDEKVFLHPRSYYHEQRIELLLGRRATRLDPAMHDVLLDDDTRLGYDQLLIATGAVPRRLSVPGAD